MNQILTNPHDDSLPRLDAYLAVLRGLRPWTAAETAMRERDPAFRLHEAEACVLLASISTSVQEQQQRLSTAVQIVDELPTPEFRITGIECLRELAPQRLHHLLAAAVRDAAPTASPGAYTPPGESDAVSLPTHGPAPSVNSTSARSGRRTWMLTSAGIAVVIGMIAFVVFVRSDPTNSGRFESSLAIILPDGTPMTKGDDLKAHAGDIVVLKSTLVSEKLHRWGLLLTDIEARCRSYSPARNDESRFDDKLRLDAHTRIDFFMVIASDEPLPELNPDVQFPPDGIVVNWLTAICPELQTLDGQSDIRAAVERATLNALRDAGFTGDAEIYTRYFFHDASRRQKESQ